MEPIIFDCRYSHSPNEVKLMGTKQLREHFLIADLFEPDKLNFTYSHYDRYIVGAVMPISCKIKLEPFAELLKEASFLTRRELGLINIGGPGQVDVDAVTHTIGFKDALYIGQGAQEIYFSSRDPNQPAKFYLNSTTAHQSYPTKKICINEANNFEIGNSKNANHRIIHQMLLHKQVKTCQLQMGLTELMPGSVWNTMPPHTHERRTEVYFYFELPAAQAISHFMGTPNETRHIWVQNEQAVISPPWSIHAGAGTSNYSFIWGMAGENLDYDDMDKSIITDLK